MAKTKFASRPHGGQRVPAVAGGAQDGVDVRALGKELAEIGVERAVGVAVLGVHHLLDRLAPTFLGIAHRDELHVFLREHPLEHPGAAAANANPAEHNALAGRHRAVSSQRGGGDDQGGGCQRRAAEELPPTQEGPGNGFAGDRTRWGRCPTGGVSVVC